LYLYVRKKADKQNRLHNHFIKAYIFFDLLLAGQLTREELIKEVCIKNPVQVSVYDAAEGNIQKGGLPLLLKEVRYTVDKNQRKHQKLLFKLLVEKDAILISSKCRDVNEPILINLETILMPYLDSEDIKALRRIAKSIYQKKNKQAS
jgi:hypothetical protein